MAIYNLHMAISVTRFKNSCLDVIRCVETTGQSVSITRRGKVAARLAPICRTNSFIEPITRRLEAAANDIG
jgi:antitoxin (DNA-binding transcriptional repressor) of toxin-antitoxin stability system